MEDKIIQFYEKKIKFKVNDNDLTTVVQNRYYHLMFEEIANGKRTLEFYGNQKIPLLTATRFSKRFLEIFEEFSFILHFRGTQVGLKNKMHTIAFLWYGGKNCYKLQKEYIYFTWEYAESYQSIYDMLFEKFGNKDKIITIIVE